MRFFNKNGVLVRGAREVSRGTLVSPDEIKDTTKLAEIIRQLSSRIAELETKSQPVATEYEVDAVSGGTIRIAHGLNCPVRFFCTYVSKKESGIQPVRTEPRVASFVQYGFTIGTWSNPGGNVSYGTRWRLKKRKEIIGVRFAWHPAGASTVRVRVYNDTTGASLASTDVSVNGPGLYEGYFSTPITEDLTGTDIVASAWQTAGLAYTYNNDSRFNAGAYEVNEDLTLKHDRLYAVGDVRPNIAQVNGHHDVEPILGNNSSGPDLVADAATDLNTLVLRSYVTGKLVVRVEPSLYGVQL